MLAFKNLNAETFLYTMVKLLLKRHHKQTQKHAFRFFTTTASAIIVWHAAIHSINKRRGSYIGVVILNIIVFRDNVGH